MKEKKKKSVIISMLILEVAYGINFVCYIVTNKWFLVALWGIILVLNSWTLHVRVKEYRKIGMFVRIHSSIKHLFVLCKGEFDEKRVM